MSELSQSTTIQGTPGNDTLVATADNQILLGLGGNDRLLSEFNYTTLAGGAGKDTLSAIVTATGEYEGFARANNTLDGGAGDDELTATATASGGLFPATSPTACNSGCGYHCSVPKGMLRRRWPSAAEPLAIGSNPARAVLG